VSSIAAQIAAAAAPVVYVVQVCTRRESGVLEIRMVSRRFKSFHTLCKAVKAVSSGDVLASAPEPPQKKLFGNEGDVFIQRRRRELQRFLDELLADPRVLTISAVREFLCLDCAPAEVIPRVKPADWGGAATLPPSSPPTAPPPPTVPPSPLPCAHPAAPGISVELETAKREVVAEAERASQLTERVQYLQGLVELRESELAGVKRRAEDRIAAL
jgi:hypothetical protein